MHYWILPTAVVALSALVSAQLLSPACTNSLATIAASPDASTCLSLASLAPVILETKNTSIVQEFDSWLTSFCATTPCSNDTLSAIVANVTTGCGSDLSLSGAPESISKALTPIVIQYYPAVRKILCLKDSNTNCITQTLTNIERFVGEPLTVSKVVALVLRVNGDSIPSNVTCTNCIKEGYNILNHDIPSLVSDVGPSAQAQCGVSFTDGTTPSGISQSAVEATTISTSSALGTVSLSSSDAFFSVFTSFILAVFLFLA
ncbi:hypothetical protein D9615_004521 [Tricholomella constricta]|uniref:Uncharacterized protein n=1 Tax=Tricholomella constricta TaxID=117010 RepID=A0A8H5M402_9AGAR|nr:hypothetical protein D9615_004521 [Tricholomella constricta]